MSHVLQFFVHSLDLWVWISFKSFFDCVSERNRKVSSTKEKKSEYIDQLLKYIVIVIQFLCWERHRQSEREKREIVRPKNVRTDQKDFQRERERESDYDVRMIDEDSNKTPEVSVQWRSSEPTDEDCSLPHESELWIDEQGNERISSERVREESTIMDHEGGTYLHFSAYLGDVNAVKILLIEDKAEVNATDEDEYTPMHLAAGQRAC